jgi:hypothetical protein
MLFTAAVVTLLAAAIPQDETRNEESAFIDSPEDDSKRLVQVGRQTFRFDTFGDEAFWGNQLKLHQAINRLPPRTALSLGLTVDSNALPPSVVEAIKYGEVNLSGPAVTRFLISKDAVLWVKGFFDDPGLLRSVGLNCAVCHSTVDNSVAPGIGKRIDGIANRDLNVGAIIAAAPDLQPVIDLLRLADPAIDSAGVRKVLNSWGPGKFDAKLFLDAKASRPDGRSAAILIPNARGLAGYNLHTWTGGWGTVFYWNAFVAVNEMHGIGTSFDERLENAKQFPIAAKAHLGHISVDPDHDRVTRKLTALQFYQLSLPP